jgi:uncharacterized FAD-dependent dehydrogenase
MDANLLDGWMRTCWMDANLFDANLLADIVSKRLGLAGPLGPIRIAKRTVNAADTTDVHFTMNLAVDVSGTAFRARKKDTDISLEIDTPYPDPIQYTRTERPVVVGCRPAGIFAALILARAGARPILLERGRDGESRRQNVLEFWRTGTLDTQSNVQFGEGGAGAFSDGKLKIGKMDFRKMMILRELVEAGAPPEIRYLSKPHIGTDRLPGTVKGILNKIISLGGAVRFNTTVTEILHQDGQVTGIQTAEPGTHPGLLPASRVVLAVGHSARDTLENLRRSGVAMEPKSLAAGVRIEHTQPMIDAIRYGAFAGHPALGAADYRMVVHVSAAQNVYTFCMCPGGTVVAAASEENGLVTNGMSEFARDGRNANCALIVTVDKKEFGSDHPLAGVAFQRRLEAAAFAAGGGGHKAPVQRLEDFMARRRTTGFGEVRPTYGPGTEFAEADTYLPESITNALRHGIREMGRWMPGFAHPDAVLTGAETRSSSPVRILRGDRLEAVSIKGLYPCGEGSGYTGGIMSAAVDGVRCAEKILES